MKRFASLVLSLVMVLSLAISSAGAVDITTGPVEVTVDGQELIVEEKTPSVMPLYTAYTVFETTRQAKQTLDTTFRCRAEYGNTCDVILKNNGSCDLIFELFGGEYAKIVSPGLSDVAQIKPQDEDEPLQVTVDIKVTPVSNNPSGTYTVTANQYNIP